MKAAAARVVLRQALFRATLAGIIVGCLVVVVIGFSRPEMFHGRTVTPTPPAATLSSSQR